MDDPMRREHLLAAGRWQSGLCDRLDAPTWAAVIDRLLAHVEAGTSAPPVELLLDDGDHPLTSNVWLRLLGAVHRVVLDRAERGEDDPVGLTEVLPSTGGRRDPEAVPDLFDRFVATFRDEVVAGMPEPVNRRPLDPTSAEHRRLPRVAHAACHVDPVGAATDRRCRLTRIGRPDSSVVRHVSDEGEV